jgi:hypothetical protein
MILDFHTHIFPPGIRENRADYLKRDPCFSELYSSPKARMATAEDLIAGMEKDGVDLSVVLNIGWVSHELCVETNDYIMESVSRYPEKLVGFCAIQPKAGGAAISEIERCAEGGLKGIGEMRPDIQGFDLGDIPLMGPIAEAAEKHQFIFLSHTSEPVGHEYPGKGNITPGTVYQFISSFPRIPFVCAHWGGGLPFYALMPEVATALGNTFFDTAASPFLYHHQIFKHVIELVGAEKILFGSDYPLLSQRRVISEVEFGNLSPEFESMVLGENAKRLLASPYGTPRG